MPTDQRRRDDIAAAVAAYDLAHPKAPLPRSAARLLATMFAHETECQRSIDDLIAEGFDRKTLSRVLRRLQEAGFLSWERGWARTPNTYRLHLPPRVQP